MKNILFLAFFLFINLSYSWAQVKLLSKAGTYIRTTDGINYESDVNSIPCDKDAPLISTEIFQGYNEPAAYPGLGEVTYYYKGIDGVCPSINNKQNLTKPIIILDGFDPGDNTSGAAIYGAYLKYKDNNQKDVFLGQRLRKTQINEIGSTDGYDVVVLNFPQYSRITGGNITTVTYPCPIPANYPNQAQICSQMGYPNTVTYGSPAQRQEIDGGTDYMERNAMVLIELIRNTNATLKANGSSEKIVIIGPSMGSLISRYALAYMEKQLALNPNDPIWQAKWTHNCRLWVSFDGPHLGANISIGAQAFLKFFGEDNGNDAAKRSLDNKIRSVAAKQLLLHHELGKTAIASGAPGFRDRFVSTMNNIGYPNPTNDPAKLRKIALTNGSINSTKFAPNDCQTVLTMQSFWTVENFLFKYFSQHLLADATIKYSGSYGNGCETFKGYFAPRNRNSVFSSAPSTTYSYDNGPGGYFNTLQILSDQGTSDFTNVPKLDYAVGAVTLATGLLHTLGFLGSGNSTHFNVNIGIHSFIPTKSSLAFKGTNPDFGEDLSGRNLVCTGETPFDSYYSPLSNENHVSLTQKSTDYVLSEIRGIKQVPSVNVGTISGADITCGTSTTYTLQNSLVGATISWVASAGISPSTGTGTSFTVSTSSGQNGSGSIAATVTDNCGNKYVTTKNVAISNGLPTPTIKILPYNGSGELNCVTRGEAYRFDAGSYTNINIDNGYEWVVPSGWNYIGGQGYRYLELSLSASGNYSPVVQVRLKNSCSTGNYVGRQINLCGGSIPMKLAYVVYPNPTQNEFKIEKAAVTGNEPITNTNTPHINEASASNMATENFEIHLYNTFGKEVRSGKSQEGALNINTIGLENGIYSLKVYKNGYLLETQQVVIVH